MIKLWLVFLLIPCDLCAQTLAEAEVLALHHKKFKWLADKNYDSVRGFLHPQVLFIHSNGWTQTVSEMVDDLKSGKSFYLSVDVQEAAARQVDNCVVVTGKGQFTGKIHDTSFSVFLLYTEVYVRKNDQWLLLQRHANRLP